MNCGRRATFIASLILLTMGAVNGLAAAAPIVWSGLSVAFSRSATGAPTDPENQDRITDQVWITRGDVGGIYNIAPGEETSYDLSSATSPSRTLWATAINNPSESIEAANYANLSFAPWKGAYDGGLGRLPDNLLNHNAVVQLLLGDLQSNDDDIYLDLQFTSWAVASGPAFSYQRGAVPEPATIFLIAAALPAFTFRLRSRRRTSAP
jgi:hypothetical protein